jgi:small GTP-binding protein
MIKQIKIVMIGLTNVGITSIINRFISNSFEDNIENTIKVDYKSIIVVENNLKYYYSIYSILGNINLSKGFYNSTRYFFIVFDITHEKSFQDVDIYYNQIKSNSIHQYVIYLIGNKKDLCSSRKVSKIEASDYALRNHMIYYETSAKTGENIEKLFLSVLDYENKYKFDDENIDLIERKYKCLKCFY